MHTYIQHRKYTPVSTTQLFLQHRPAPLLPTEACRGEVWPRYLYIGVRGFRLELGQGCTVDQCVYHNHCILFVIIYTIKSTTT